MRQKYIFFSGHSKYPEALQQDGSDFYSLSLPFTTDEIKS